jgi:hypothetical protein
MQRLLDEGKFTVYKYCLWEVVQKCLSASCLDCEGIVNGEWQTGLPRTFKSICNGKMRQADGFIKKEDTINRFMTLDRETWDSQQECLSPEREGLVHSWFDNSVDVQKDSLIGIYEGIDWGCDDPSVCLWIQKRGQEFWVLDELYQTDLGVMDFIYLIKAKRVTEGYNDIWGTFPDPTGKAERLDFEREGIPTSIQFEKNVKYGLSVLRSFGEKKQILISSKCVNLVREMGEYRKKPPREGRLRAEYIGAHHACDSLRYGILGILNQEQDVPSLWLIGGNRLND